MLITQEGADEERDIAASGRSLTPITQPVASGHRPTKRGESQRAGTGTKVVRLEGLVNGNELSGPPLFRDSPIVQKISARCASWKGDIYPPPGANDAFESIRSRLIIKESTIAGRGTFFDKGKLLKHEAFGFYEGILTKPEGAYTMTLFKGPNAIHVNEDPAIIG